MVDWALKTNYLPTHLTDPGNATAATRAALSPVLQVFSCFRNPLNSDMNYRNCNVRTDHSYACVYTRGLDWTHRQRVSTTFLIQKQLSQICIVLLAGFELESVALPIEPPRHPIYFTLWPPGKTWNALFVFEALLRLLKS